MTQDEKQRLQHELSDCKMELVFSDECGDFIVSNYIAQKEAGKTPTININQVNAKREAIVARMEEIKAELEKN